MKRFGIILLSCVIAITLLFGDIAYAQIEEELPSPGITPDSPFYFVDIWGKKVGLFFAFGTEAKTKKALEYAEERLAEAQVMAAKNKSKAVKVAASSYEEYMAIIRERARVTERVRERDASDNISAVVALATSKHLLVLDGLDDIVPEQAKEAIAQAKGASINGMGNALRLLARENARRAIEINLAAAEGRLNRANDEADKNNTDGVNDAVHEFEVLSGFGQEISELARGLSDNTTVDELVARATRHHLDVLALVYEKVPESAWPGIERAMEVSVRGHERAVEVLKEKGALPKGISDNITTKAKEGRRQSP